MKQNFKFALHIAGCKVDSGNESLKFDHIDNQSQIETEYEPEEYVQACDIAVKLVKDAFKLNNIM